MKNVVFLISVVFVFTACNQTNGKLKERIINSDSVAINYFKGDGTMDTVVLVKIIRDRKMINQLATLIVEKKGEANFKCGYDGTVHFFKMNSVIQDLDFNMQDANCMHFSFMQEGKPATTILLPEAKQLLESFRK
jgi:hypothetical protein